MAEAKGADAADTELVKASLRRLEAGQGRLEELLTKLTSAVPPSLGPTAFYAGLQVPFSSAEVANGADPSTIKADAKEALIDDGGANDDDADFDPDKTGWGQAFKIDDELTKAENKRAAQAVQAAGIAQAARAVQGAAKQVVDAGSMVKDQAVELVSKANDKAVQQAKDGTEVVSLAIDQAMQQVKDGTSKIVEQVSLTADTVKNQATVIKDTSAKALGDVIDEAEALQALLMPHPSHNGPAERGDAGTIPANSIDEHCTEYADQAAKKECERQRILFKALARSKGWLVTSKAETAEPTHSIDDMQIPSHEHKVLAWLGRQIESGVFDMFFGGLILVNAMVMLLKLEHKGQQIGYEYGLENAEKESWPGVETVWDILDFSFTILFGIEIVLRFCVMGKHFFVRPWNLFDFALVTMAIVELATSNVPVDLTLFRLLRLLRLARVLRIIRVMRSFRPLRILVQTTLSSFFALFWSVVLVGLILVMSAVFMGQLLQGTLEDPSTTDEAREAVWEYFGTAGRACYTLFKWTLTGTWANGADPLIKQVNRKIAIFVVVYVVAVNFALTRVVGAVFIKDTWAAAQKDTEMVIEESLRKDGAVVRQLKALFQQFDVDENGALDKKEFTRAMQDTRLKQWLRCLELDVHEASSLFVLMDNGSGTLTCDELIAGAMTLRGDAKAVDLASLMYENQRTRSLLKDIFRQVCMCTKLVRMGWDSPKPQQQQQVLAAAAELEASANSQILSL